MKPKFTISSHIHSYKQTYDTLVASLLDSGVPKEDIYFFIGGYREYKKIDNRLGVNLYEVNHNSIDLTGLISVIELGLESDYWFLLHDTTKVGLNFYKNVISAQYGINCIALTSDGRSMNMGTYSDTVLKAHTPKILERKNTDYSAKGLQDAKKLAVETEDFFLDPIDGYYNITSRVYSETVNYYGTGVARITEYYPDVDMLKIKANWHIKETYELHL